MSNGTKLNLIRDINGYATQGVPFSDKNIYFSLTQNSVTNVTIPATWSDASYAMYMLVTTGKNVYVLPAASPTLTAPTGTPTATLAQLINPNFPIRTVVPGQALQFLTADTGVDVSLCFYANIQN